jgi:uncharacterized damage-inducible protein DinB
MTSPAGSTPGDRALPGALIDHKAHLVSYLDAGRDTVLWKIEGLSEHDLRRPLTPTGTNVLGLLKHLAAVEAGYLGLCVDRPFPEPLPGDRPEDHEQADMFARADETPDDIRAFASRVRAHADATIAALDLDAVGAVPWWPPERRAVTLHQILTHLIAEWHRHTGQLDILRESLDGAVGYRRGNPNLPPGDDGDHTAYVTHLQEIADRHR